MSTAQYGMVIDLRSCTGCQTCVISCKTANEVPEEGFWSHVIDYYEGETYIASEVDGKVDMKFRSTLCNHCANPACVAACPTGAMHKSEETGIVSVDQDICIGCNTCGNTCPYEVPVLQEERCVMGKCNRVLHPALIIALRASLLLHSAVGSDEQRSSLQRPGYPCCRSTTATSNPQRHRKTRKPRATRGFLLQFMVVAEGFEPPTLCL